MTSSTSADSRRKGGERTADSEAGSDVGSEITSYWNAAAELDRCSERSLVASEESKNRQALCQMRLEESNAVTQARKTRSVRRERLRLKRSLFL